MEIVDELTTPGCPQCAYKHLSAALSYLADFGAADCPRHDILVARAKVNLVECQMGYRKHLPFAVGLLERAETAAVEEGYASAARGFIRTARVMLIRDGEAAIQKALAELNVLDVGGSAMMWAHIVEANREFKFDRPVTADEIGILDALASIRKDYFDLPDEQPGKGGESTMACTKKAACKGGKCAAPKGSAKKAACKGGKCK